MHVARAATRKARSLLCPGSLPMRKDLFWRWKAVRLEMRLVAGKSGVVARIVTILMEVLAKNLRQIV